VATKHGNLEQIPPESHHEVSDVSARPIFYFAIALVMLIILTLISMKGLFNFLDQEADRSDNQLSGVASERPKLPPLPRLETDPVAVRKQYFQNEKRLIESYGWVDQKQGIVRVPIKRAMELLVERGLPVMDEAEVNTGNEGSLAPKKQEAEKSPSGK
jgi:hypothetical protein